MSTRRCRVFCVVGARPNMMKVAPILRAMQADSKHFSPVLVHTGQHYDYAMSQVFFEQLNMPDPDYNLEVGSGTHHAQTAEVIRRFGEVVEKDRPDLVLVVGDVNSTLACALVAAKENILVAHVEAGLRSFDRTMPEEINRLVTDSISDFLFITEESARVNLKNEGVADNKVFFTGNVMIDSVVSSLDVARRSNVRESYGLKPLDYAILTLHRPSNVGDAVQLRRTLEAVATVGRELPVIFPAHPRTANKLREMDIQLKFIEDGIKVGDSGIWAIPPAPYIDFLGLVDSSAMVITDSGGIQEETTYLGVPCLTYRDNTERPATVTHGTNQLIGANPENLVSAALEVLSRGKRKSEEKHEVPPLWDGMTASRILDVLKDKCCA